MNYYGQPSENLLKPFSSYTNLAADSNWAKDGRFAQVTASGLEADYQYVDTVDGVSVGLWLPKVAASRISGLVEDASSNKCYIDITGGDDYATVTGRGWSDDSTSTADVQDATSGDDNVLEFDSDSGGNALLSFTPTSIPSEFLLYQEIDCIERNGTTGNSACRLQVRNASKLILVSHSRSGTNSLGFAKTYNTSTGDGVISHSAFDPVFCHLYWSADKRFSAHSPVSTDQSNAFYDNAASGGATTVNWGTGSQASNRFHLKKFYMFDLS